MSLYKCVKKLVVDELEDGDTPTGNDFIVEVGEFWKLDSISTRNTDVGREVYMSNEDGGWLQIWDDMLDEHFEVLEESS